MASIKPKSSIHHYKLAYKKQTKTWLLMSNNNVILLFDEILFNKSEVICQNYIFLFREVEVYIV